MLISIYSLIKYHNDSQNRNGDFWISHAEALAGSRLLVDASGILLTSSGRQCNLIKVPVTSRLSSFFASTKTLEISSRT